MTDDEFAELRAATRQHIAAVYEVPDEMVAAWDDIDQQGAGPVRPDEEPT